MHVPAIWIWLATHALLTPGLSEEVSVTATRRPARGLDTPAAVSVVPGDRLALAPATVLDDALRETPGFSLFRRSSSRTANPTAQGATLRGLSASGAGRTLVLADGVPLNDPFGAWVSWLRVPQAAVERVEAARGAIGDLHGPDAAGGVIQVLSREPGPAWRGLLVADAGGQGTSRVSAWSGRAAGPLGWTLAAERFDSEGAVPLEAAARGAVDEPAGVAARSAVVALRVAPASPVSLTLRGDAFDEDRTNGTALQRNDTNLRQGRVELTAAPARGALRAQVTRVSQAFDQTFTAVVADRSRESLTAAQRVSANRTFASAEWTGATARAAWLAGGDLRWADGRNRETRFVAGQPAGVTDLDGAHHDAGAFVQAVVPVTRRGVLTAGARVDAWGIDLPAAGRDETLVRWSPRVSWSQALTPSQALHASAYRAFRPPTLNELVRGFRVGNVQTLANPALVPEQLSGGEVAWHWQAGPRSVRAVAFLSSMDEAIVNATVAVTPSLITRERRNAGRVRSRGVELETSWRLGRAVSARGALALTDATVVEAAEAALRGRRVPQVPRWQAAAGLDANVATVGASVTVRATGAQFDDDRNQFTLRRAVVADASGWWRPHPRVTVVGAVENVADADYDVGRTPLRTVGTPRLARLGVRVGW